MKKNISLLLILFSTILFAQKEKSSKMGQTTIDELKMTIYSKDSTAAALVLYEHVNIYLDPENDYKTRNDYYFRIKILDKTAFDEANIVINQFKKERVINIKGITYNLSDNGTKVRNTLSNDKIFKIEETKNWTSYKFTMPNIQVGSVIEYSYSILSPYLGINDWYFQSNIPKIKSDLDAAILGNYEYNVRIIGALKLNKDNPSIIKNCVEIPGVGVGACSIFSYGMTDIPAFKEEDYMLSKKNYISHLSFDLKKYTSTRGIIENYTTTWKQADKKLKKIFFNNQTSKKSFFKKNIPVTILTLEKELERARNIYKYIQDHYTWNETFWNNEDEKVKQAYNNKSGSTGEINLSLFNALNAAEIKTDLVILSTRNNGLPTTLYPIIFDFNYVIVKVTIDQKDYYLDATDKYTPFGQVPFRVLNGQARVINYKKESNWVKLIPKIKSTKKITAKLVLNEDGDINGNLLIYRQGYPAQRQRKKLGLIGEDNFLEEFETNNPDVEVEDYSVKYEDNLDKQLIEIFKINILLDDGLNEKIRINPFFFDRLKENPFKLKERNYPVDFGFKKRNNFLLNLKIPDTYKLTQVPKSMAISLPNKAGSFVLKVSQKENIVNIYSRWNLNRSHFTSDEYFALKEFFNQIVIAENSFLTLERR